MCQLSQCVWIISINFRFFFFHFWKFNINKQKKTNYIFILPLLHIGQNRCVSSVLSLFKLTVQMKTFGTRVVFIYDSKVVKYICFWPRPKMFFFFILDKLLIIVFCYFYYFLSMIFFFIFVLFLIKSYGFQNILNRELLQDTMGVKLVLESAWKII